MIQADDQRGAYADGEKKKTEEELRSQRWDAFAQVLCAKRKEAVDGRKESGIEDVWALCEEHYHGIDDTNRDQFRGGYSGNSWTKPTSLAGSMTRPAGRKSATANGFVRLTARYVDAGKAKLGEITIPIDGKCFSLKSTPVPEALEAKDDESPVVLEDGQTPMRPPQPGEQVPDGAQAVPVTKADLAKHQIKKAETAATKAETRIHDWLTEAAFPRQLRKSQFDMARLGVGVIKGPVPDKRRAVMARRVGETLEIVAQESAKPVARWVDPWNFFPDPACAEEIQDGDYVWERDFLSSSKLEALKRNKAYLAERIDEVLIEGPDKTLLVPEHQKSTASRKQFTVWYFYGRIEVQDLEIANQTEYDAAIKSGMKPTDSVFAIVTLVNDTPIRVTLAPLEESQEFPYHTAPWCRRSGHWAGVGPGEQLFFPQKLINAATRAGMANAAKSAGGIMAVDSSALEPANSPDWEIVPDMVLWRADEATMVDVRAAIAMFQIPNVTPAMMAWIEYAFRLAEESTNIPLITQGQSGKFTPDTFSGQQLQDSNAMQLLRDVGYSVAEGIINPMTRQMYEWLLLDPDIPPEEKGDAQVDANAAVALVEKALQDQALAMMHPLVQDPECGFDKRAYAKTWVRIRRMNPDDVMLSDEEYQKRASQPPPPPPPIAVAQIRAQSAEKIAASRDQLAAEKIRVDTDRDTVYNSVMAGREQANAAARIEEMRLQRDLKILDMMDKREARGAAREQNLDTIKADLATEAAKLRAQMALSGNDGKGPQVAEPAIEPEGRAPADEAFQR